MRKLLFILSAFVILSCNNSEKKSSGGGDTPVSQYFNYGDSGVQEAGIKMIPIETPVRIFKVWTKRFGNIQK